MAEIKQKARYCEKEELRPHPDFDGVAMWTTVLQNMMVAYVEIEANTILDMHSHAHEQISTVIEGELFFETDEGVVCVKKGNMMAFPANVPHGAFTKDKKATVIDVWSPVRDRFQK